MNVIAAYLRADVIEVPISYRPRCEDSSSKLNTIRDGVRILNFAMINWIASTPMQPFVLLTAVMALISSLLGYRVIAGFLETGGYIPPLQPPQLPAALSLSWRYCMVWLCAL
jgi:hypothetical protein